MSQDGVPSCYGLAARNSAWRFEDALLLWVTAIGTAIAVATPAARAVAPRVLRPKGPLPACHGASGVWPRMRVRVEGGDNVTRSVADGGEVLADHVRVSARLSPHSNQYTPPRGTAVANSPAWSVMPRATSYRPMKTLTFVSATALPS